MEYMEAKIDDWMSAPESPSFDVEAVSWAYSRCLALGLETVSMENALMMDGLKLMLMNA